MIDYCQAWYDAVDGAGYVPGFYVGAGALLSIDELSALPFPHYWRSPSRVPDVTNGSYQVLQLFPSVEVSGIQVGLDITKNDNQGGTALWLRAPAAS